MAAGFQPDAFDPGAFYVGATAGGPSGGGTVVGNPGNVPPLYAIAGMARSGAVRAGWWPHDRWLKLIIGGQNMLSNLWLGTLTVNAQINRRQDTCSFQTFDYCPPRNSEIIVSADSDARRVFGGTVQTTYSQVGPKDKHNIYVVDCIDYTRLLDAAPNGLITTRYQNVPGDYAIRDILTKWCPGFSARGVPVGLPFIDDEIMVNETPVNAIDRIVTAIKSSGNWVWYVDYYKAIHVIILETNKAASVEPGRFHYSNFVVNRDGSQQRNRFYGLGGGGNTQADYPVGTTVFTVDSVLWYPDPYIGSTLIVPGIGQVFTLANVNTGTKQITVNEPSLWPIPQNSSFNNFVQVDDLTAQAALYAAYPTDPAQGVRSGYVTDGRKTRDSITQLAASNLAQFSGENVYGTYETWTDVRQGQLVDINLPDRKTWGTFQVQQVRTQVYAQARRIKRTVTYSENLVMDFHQIIRAIKAARRT